MAAAGKEFFAIVNQWPSGPLWYFTGNIVQEKPEFSINVHDAAEFGTEEDAKFGLFMLGDRPELSVQEHAIML